MSVQVVLDDSRQSTEGCTVVAFGDFRARLILLSSQEDHVRREDLDTLCSEAATSFARLDAISTIAGVTPPVQSCGIVKGKTTTAFVRSGSSDGEFICISGTFSTSIYEAMNLATRILQDVEEAV